MCRQEVWHLLGKACKESLTKTNGRPKAGGNRGTTCLSCMDSTSKASQLASTAQFWCYQKLQICDCMEVWHKAHPLSTLHAMCLLEGSYALCLVPVKLPT